MGANAWGRDLRAARKSEGHSQAVAAERLDISRVHLSSLERGEKDPSVDVARRVWAVYQVPLRLLAEPADERQSGEAA